MWKLEVPPRTVHFIWRIYNRTVLVRSRLCEKGVVLHPIYPRCGSTEETLEHAFRYCFWVSNLWSLSKLNLSWTFDAQLPIEDWFKQNIELMPRKEVELFAAIAYGI